VVFADWLEGFGNVLVIDHGSGYLSLYGNNSTLLKASGDTVRRGESVARVGNSGGQPQTGLYFEIRWQGKPVNPTSWLGR
jgi:septal ring factor EnvC (AmiA/AmiB activator)